MVYFLVCSTIKLMKSRRTGRKKTQLWINESTNSGINYWLMHNTTSGRYGTLSDPICILYMKYVFFSCALYPGFLCCRHLDFKRCPDSIKYINRLHNQVKMIYSDAIELASLREYLAVKVNHASLKYCFCKHCNCDLYTQILSN